VRVLADAYTDRQTQTDFIICLMLYAIASLADNDDVANVLFDTC